MSLMVETTTACLRLCRSSNVRACLLHCGFKDAHASKQAAIVRYHAILALEKAILTAKRALTDSLMRDVIKQMRSALSDKSLPVVRAATNAGILSLTSTVVLTIRYIGAHARVPVWRRCKVFARR